MFKKFELILILKINVLFFKFDLVFLIIDIIFIRVFFNIKFIWFILIFN